MKSSKVVPMMGEGVTRRVDGSGGYDSGHNVTAVG